MLQDPSLRAPIAVALGAVVGAVGRYYVTLGSSHWFGSPLYGTLLVNLLGAGIMGFFTTLVLSRVSIPREVVLLVGTGFLGSLTTFSTYALDTVGLLGARSFLLALVYWLGSAAGGVISLYAGMFIARLLQ